MIQALQFPGGLGLSPGAGSQSGLFFAHIDNYATQSVEVRLVGTAGVVINVNFGDGTITPYTMTGSAVAVTHSYTANGSYYISLTGNLAALTEVYSFAWGSQSYRLTTLAPTGALPLRNVTKLRTSRIVGNLANLLSALPGITDIYFGYGTDGDGNYCQFDVGDIAGLSAFTTFGLVYDDFDYVTGELSDFADCSSLTGLYLGNTGVTGAISDLAALPLSILKLNGSTGIELIEDGVDYSAWAANVTVSLSGLVGLTVTELANLLNDMYTTSTWSGASVTVTGCNGGSCTAAQLDARAYTNGWYGAETGWIANVLNPAHITVNTD